MPFLADSPREWPLLRPTTWGRLLVAAFYESLVLTRLALYRLRLLRTERAPVPVISVGNLTVGGSGKTPVVEFLLRTLAPRSVAVLSRGYGREGRSTLQRYRAEEGSRLRPESVGDEPYLLAQRHPSVAVYACASRATAARLAQMWDAPECLVLDDAYQHLAMERDLNLLLIDAERGLGNRHLLPAGPLREPDTQWKRADAILITKANLGFVDALMLRLRQELKPTCPIFRFQYLPTALVRLDGHTRFLLETEQPLRGQTVFGSCGIAQPEGFRKSLEQLGATVVELASLRDHQAYDAATVETLKRRFQRSGASRWVVTEKDAVKLAAFPELQSQVEVLEMQAVPEPAWNAFFEGFLTQHRLHA